MIWQRLSRHEIEVVFAHRRRAGARRHRGLRVERRRPRRRNDCEYVWEYDDEYRDDFGDPPGGDHPTDDRARDD